VLPGDAAKDPAFAERFAREGRALARLSHAHIVNIFDSGNAGGLYYFVMEYVDGTNLRELVRAKTTTPKQALGIVGRCATRCSTRTRKVSCTATSSPRTS
jgi:serine/threonine protein kinase